MKRAKLFQFSIMNGLLEGLYESEKTIGEIAEHGDFGLGTFNGMDGEMVAYNGEFYQIKADGTSSKANMSQKTPFASVTNFKADIVHEITESINKEGLDQLMKQLTPGPNLFYAIHLEGYFSTVRTRTVSKQHKPYKKFMLAVNDQKEFIFHDKQGLLAGFYSPDYMQGITVAGYHLHFITELRNGGGHTLDFMMEKGKVEIQILEDYEIELPSNEKFINANLGGDRSKEIEFTEG